MYNEEQPVQVEALFFNQLWGQERLEESLSLKSNQIWNTREG
jgi:hypothetical protein